MSSLFQLCRTNARELLYQPQSHPSEASFSNRSKSSITTYINPSVASQLHPNFPFYLLMFGSCTLGRIFANTRKQPRSGRRSISYRSNARHITTQLYQTATTTVRANQQTWIEFETLEQYPRTPTGEETQSSGSCCSKSSYSQGGW